MVCSDADDTVTGPWPTTMSRLGEEAPNRLAALAPAARATGLATAVFEGEDDTMTGGDPSRSGGSGDSSPSSSTNIRRIFAPHEACTRSLPPDSPTDASTTESPFMPPSQTTHSKLPA